MSQYGLEPPDHIFTIVRRTEESLRSFITSHMQHAFGHSWVDHLPGDIRKTGSQPGDPLTAMASSDEIWHESYFRHLSGAITRNWNNVFANAVQGATKNEVQVRLDAINKIRQRAYHSKPVHAADLRQVASEAEAVANFMGGSGIGLKTFLGWFWQDPEAYTVPIPKRKQGADGLFVNVPVYDFELIGRGQEMRELEEYVMGRDAVITIAGRGGVGKTALATKLVHHLWDKYPAERPFKAIIWVTGKNAELKETGIVDLQPQLSTYEQLIETIDTVLEGDGGSTNILEDMEANVQTLLSMDDTPVLVVIDNLETISEDYRIIEFIKNVPDPSKILVTSRIGIGEVERRLPLTGLNGTAARHLARMTARDAGDELTGAILSVDDAKLSDWLSPVDGVAVAIKWMVAQVGLGLSFEKVKAVASSSESELIEFLFRDVYNLLTESAKTMMCVLTMFSDHAPTDELWRMVSGLGHEDFDEGKRQLVLASMITHTIDDGRSRYRLAGMSESFAVVEFENLEDVRHQSRQRYRQFLATAQADMPTRTNARTLSAYRRAANQEELVALTYTNNGYESWERERDVESARSQFSEALNIMPSFYFTYRTWAEVEDKAGFYERSDRLMSEMVANNPHDPEIYVDWANILRFSNSQPPQDRISELLAKAYGLAPDDIRIVHMYADSERRRHEYQRAEQLLETDGANVRKNDSSRDDLRWYISRIHLYNTWANHLSSRQNQFEAAIEKLAQAKTFIENALNIWPNEFDILFAEKTNRLNLGTTYSRAGRSQEALRELDGALFDKAILTSVENTHNARVELSRAITYRSRQVRDLEAARAAAEKGITYALNGNREYVADRLRRFLADL